MPGRTPHIHVFVSDRAWAGIRMMANKAPGAVLAGFIKGLPGSPSAYKDARPDWMRNDADNVAMGRWPMWSYEEPRIKHSVRINADTRAVLLRVAVAWHITNHLRCDSCVRTTSRISAFLEALGSGLLTIKYDTSLEDKPTS